MAAEAEREKKQRAEIESKRKQEEAVIEARLLKVTNHRIAMDK